MKLVTDFNNIIKDEKWKSLISCSHFSSPFQTQDYYDFLKKNKYYDGYAFALIDGNEIKALMVVSLMKEPGFKAYFSRRGIILGGPVLNNDINKTDLTFFLKEVSKRLKRKAIYLETRNFNNYTEYKEAFQKAGWHYQPYLNFQLSFRNIEKNKLSSFFKYNRRREIKLSIKYGANYRLANNEKEITEIYNILRELYKKRVKVPLPPQSFFLGLFRKNIIKVFIVKHENKTIGGSFCPILANKSIYTFYYCGIRNYHKRIFPTHLAILAAMEYAIDKNIPMMDFMGAGKPELDYGVRRYKSEFGGELVEHGRFSFVLNPLMYYLGVLGMKVLKRIN